RVERVREYLVQRQIPRARLGLIGKEADDRLARPFSQLHLGIAGSHASQISGERVGKQVLARAVETELLGRTGCLLKGLPREGMQIFIVRAKVMSHDQRDVVAAMRDLPVYKQAGVDRLGDPRASQR